MHPDDAQANAILEGPVEAAIAQMTEDRFSTRRIIAELRATLDGEAAYQAALQTLAPDPGSEHMGLLVLHGQVVPGILRRSKLVRFGGFIHGNPAEDDGLAVPSLWIKVPTAETR